MAAALLMANLLHGQRALPAQTERPTYFEMHDLLKERAEEAEKKRERENRWSRSKRTDEVPEEMIYEQWNYFWKDRMQVNGSRPGELADVADYALAGSYASNPAMRGPGAPTTQAVPAICTTGNQGNWSAAGPFTFQSPIMGNVTSLYVNPTNQNTILAGSSRGGLFKTTNGGTSWTNLTDASRLPCMGITSIVVHPTNSNTIFIGSSSGLPFKGDFNYGYGVFRSTDGGVTWSEILPITDINNEVKQNSQVNKMMLHPQDANILYVLIGQKVFRTLNANAATPTWTVMTSIPDDPSYVWNYVDIDIINGTLGVSNSKIILCTSFSSSPTSVALNAQAFVSTNGGTTFTNITSVLVTQWDFRSDRYAAAVQHGGSSDEIYFATPYGAHLYIRKYTFSTNSIIEIGNTQNVYSSSFTLSLGVGYFKFEFEFSKINPNRFYLGGLTVYAFRINSSTVSVSRMSEYWPVDLATGNPQYNTHCDIRYMTILTSGSNDAIYAGTDGGVCRSIVDPAAATMPTYSTSNWANLNGTGLTINQFFDLSGSETIYNLLVAGAQDNGTFEWSGGTWKLREISDAYQGVINPLTNNFIGNSLRAAYKGATNTSGLYTDILLNPAWSTYNTAVVSHPDNPQYIVTSFLDTWVDPDKYKLYYSLNFGSNYYEFANFPADGLGITAIQIAPSNPNVIYVAKGGATWNTSGLNRLYKSTNGGLNWTDLGQFSSTFKNTVQYAGITSIAVDPFNENRVFIGFNGYWAVDNVNNRYTGVNRVFKSTDGGTTWSDMTNASLPACPTISLAYRTGSNDELYVGNDYGVYRYNSTTNVWECFSNQLPVTLISGLEIHNCKNMLRASTLGRGIWETPLPALGAYEITSNRNITGNLYIGTDVVVKPGVTLNITGTLWMSKDKRLIVERGATVNITNGGKITNACGDLWYGIELWGTYNVAQSTAGAQGKVVINGGTIENAHNGITTIKNANASWDWAYTGGIIEATNASFLNNRRDIQMLSYHSPSSPEPDNLSFFKSSLFETNQALNGGFSPTTRISLHDVKGIKIEGCTIQNTATSFYSINNRGTGVGTADATFVLNDLYPNYTPSSPISHSVVSGLTIGVQADFTSGSTRNASVVNTTFTNVQRSITYNYSTGSLVSNNIINALPNAASSSSTASTWGIRMNNASAHVVSWNSISGASSSTLNNYGIIIDNCGSSANSVASNNLTNLYGGIQAQGNNGTANTGLKVTCNTFVSGLTYQFVVCPQVAGSIANQSSGCSKPVRNNFCTAAVTYGHVYSPYVMFVYYAANGTAPTNYSTNLSLVSCATSVNCPVPDGNETSRLAEENEESILNSHASSSPEFIIENQINTGVFDVASRSIAAYPNSIGRAYYEVALNIARRGGNWFLMNENEQRVLEAVAASDVPQQLAAQTVLHFVNGTEFEKPVERISEEANLFADTEADALLENQPNPFTDFTVVHCKVNDNAQNAQLVITNTLGEVISRHQLTPGVNMVTITNDKMVSGIYLCTLTVDGKTIATRKMLSVSK